MTAQVPEPAGLTREAVTRAALELLDTVGADGLSMRAVAERLGVKAASLYWHLRDKEQLLELVAQAVLDGVTVPQTAGPWRPRVEAVCADVAAGLAQRRAAAAVVVGCLAAVQRSRLVSDLAGILAAAGLEHAESAAFTLVLEATAAALVTTEATVRPHRGAPMTLAIDSGSWRVAVRAAPPGTVDVATSVGGGGAASVDVRPGGLVVVRNRRGGNRGAVELSPEYAWHIKVHGGTWNTTLDLSGLRVAAIELDSGGGNITCTLPSPIGVVPIKVNSGIVGVSLHRPRYAAAHATVSSGSAKVRLDGRAIRAVTSDVYWETPGASRSDDRYELTVSSGCVRVTMDPSAAAAPPPPPTAEAAQAAPGWAGTMDQGVSLVLDGIERRLAGV
jgi:AcrR family transcriptional regulator